MQLAWLIAGAAGLIALVLAFLLIRVRGQAAGVQPEVETLRNRVAEQDRRLSEMEALLRQLAK